MATILNPRAARRLVAWLKVVGDGRNQSRLEWVTFSSSAKAERPDSAGGTTTSMLTVFGAGGALRLPLSDFRDRCLSLAMASSVRKGDRAIRVSAFHTRRALYGIVSGGFLSTLW